MIIKVATKKNPDGSIVWTNLYSSAIRNRLRRDMNLADVEDIAEARKNLGIKDYVVSVSDDIEGNLKQYVDQQDLAFYDLIKGYINNTAIPSVVRELKAYHDSNSGSGSGSGSDSGSDSGSGAEPSPGSGSYTPTSPTLTINVEGIKPDINGVITRYGICRTVPDVADKTVTVSNGENFSLSTGVRITVKFMNTNIVEAPNLSVNGTTSRPIYYRGYPIIAEALQENATYDLIYNGSQWEIIGSVLWIE